MHVTYLMRRGSHGCRVGVTRTYSTNRAKPVLGLQIRCNGEHADAAWVVSTHDTDAEARAAEHSLSVRYGIPTIPFVARRGPRSNGLVGNQALIDQVFADADSDEGGLRLVRDYGLDVDHPHKLPHSHEGRRRIVMVTLCGDPRTQSTQHRVTVAGRDPEVAERLRDRGISVRASKNGGWRVETSFSDFEDAVRLADQIADCTPVVVRYVARLAKRVPGQGASLPFMPASSVRPGMVMVDEDGAYDLVERVERSISTSRSTTSTSTGPTTSSPTASSRTTRSTASAAPTSATSSTSRTTSTR